MDKVSDITGLSEKSLSKRRTYQCTSKGILRQHKHRSLPNHRLRKFKVLETDLEIIEHTEREVDDNLVLAEVLVDVTVRVGEQCARLALYHVCKRWSS